MDMLLLLEGSTKREGSVKESMEVDLQRKERRPRMSDEVQREAQTDLPSDKHLLERLRHPPDALLHVGVVGIAEARPEANLVGRHLMLVVRAED